ncbi:hypothetical protein [Alishewanella longhuensis]
MSVINKMLQDLQQRNANASEQGSSVSTQSLQWQAPKRSFKLLWGIFALLLLVLLGWYGVAQQQAVPEAAVLSTSGITEDIGMLPSAAPAAELQPIGPANQQTTALLATELPMAGSEAPTVEISLTTQTLAATEPKIAQVASEEAIVNDKPGSKAITEPQLAAVQTPIATLGLAQEPSLTQAPVLIKEPGLTQAPGLTKEPSLTIEQAPVSVLQQKFDLAVKAAAAQQWQQALEYLTAEQPVATFPAYFALKAAVLQQQAEWSAALELYQQLLQLEPNHAGWNLAAGISAQQLSANVLAQRFYAIAWQHRTQLPAASQAYLQQQLSLMK